MKFLIAVLLTLAVASGKPANQLEEKDEASRAICSLVICDIYCPNGHAVDARRCPLCSCNDLITPIPLRLCPLVVCDIFCPNGLKIDAEGCHLCQCNDIYVV